MTYDLFFPEVEEDVIAGYVWYEGKSPGLSEEFLRMFYACAGELLRNPLLYPRVHNEFGRRLLRRSPYAIYFMVEDDQIVVFGFFHCARDPRTIQIELRDRQEQENPFITPADG